VTVRIDEACTAGARVTAACNLVAISPRTLQRWRAEGEVKADGRKPAGQQREPANKLSEAEHRQILAVANEPEFAHMPPSQIVPILADRGRYIASESSFYRVLREANQLAHRGKAKAPRHNRPTPLQASVIVARMSRSSSNAADSTKQQGPNALNAGPVQLATGSMRGSSS